jgi:hypothetical protein
MNRLIQTSPIENTLDSSDGEKKSVEGVAYAVAFRGGDSYII